jgi:hypothetical protein
VARGADKNEKRVPVIVTMRVKCRCGHTEDETYELEMPIAGAEPREEDVPGTCHECHAPILIHLKRTSALQ